MTTKKGSTKRPKNGKAGHTLPVERLTAGRIRSIFADPKTKTAVRKRLNGLIGDLFNEHGAGDLEETPELVKLEFEAGAFGLRYDEEKGNPNDGRPIFEEIVKLAERHEPEECKVARRCVEICNDWLGRKEGREHPEGAFHFMRHIDAVLEAGEGVLVSYDSEYFAPFFVKAARERGPKDYHYRALLDLIRRVDEGADLNALADEGKRQKAERK